MGLSLACSVCEFSRQDISVIPLRKLRRKIMGASPLKRVAEFLQENSGGF